MTHEFTARSRRKDAHEVSVFILNACLITRLYGYKLQPDAMYAESEVKRLSKNWRRRHSVGI